MSLRIQIFSALTGPVRSGREARIYAFLLSVLPALSVCFVQTKSLIFGDSNASVVKIRYT